MSLRSSSTGSSLPSFRSGGGLGASSGSLTFRSGGHTFRYGVDLSPSSKSPSSSFVPFERRPAFPNQPTTYLPAYRPANGDLGSNPPPASRSRAVQLAASQSLPTLGATLRPRSSVAPPQARAVPTKQTLAPQIWPPALPAHLRSAARTQPFALPAAPHRIVDPIGDKGGWGEGTGYRSHEQLAWQQHVKIMSRYL